MNASYYLYAAYSATWIIHLTYLGILARRYARLRREIEGLKSKQIATGH
jgi:CcmD family protein